MRQRDPFEEIALVTGRVQAGLWRASLANGHELLAYAGRAVKQMENEICVGSRIVVKFTPFDLSKARVVKRVDG